MFFANSRLLPAILLIALLALSGCAAVDKKTIDAFKSIPEVQSFLSANPDAQVSGYSLDRQIVEGSQRELLKSCPALEVKDYFLLVAKSADERIEALIDKKTREPACIIRTKTDRCALDDFNCKSSSGSGAEAEKCGESEVLCSGECVVPLCSSNDACNDNNEKTNDVCRNAGKCTAKCENSPLVCRSNELFCDGACKKVACKEDSDCNDREDLTEDSCKKAGACDAYCENRPEKYPVKISVLSVDDFSPKVDGPVSVFVGVANPDNHNLQYTLFVGDKAFSNTSSVKTTILDSGKRKIKAVIHDVDLDENVSKEFEVNVRARTDTPLCKIDANCDDGIDETADKCEKAGTWDSLCKNSPADASQKALPSVEGFSKGKTESLAWLAGGTKTVYSKGTYSVEVLVLPFKNHFLALDFISKSLDTFPKKEFVDEEGGYFRSSYFTYSKVFWASGNNAVAVLSSNKETVDLEPFRLALFAVFPSSSAALGVCRRGEIACDNECVKPACVKDSDCNDKDAATDDRCESANSCEASCKHSDFSLPPAINFVSVSDFRPKAGQNFTVSVEAKSVSGNPLDYVIAFDSKEFMGKDSASYAFSAKGKKKVKATARDTLSGKIAEKELELEITDSSSSPSCVEDANCDDGIETTTDSCREAGTASAFCRNLPESSAELQFAGKLGGFKLTELPNIIFPVPARKALYESGGLNAEVLVADFESHAHALDFVYTNLDTFPKEGTEKFKQSFGGYYERSHLSYRKVTWVSENKAIQISSYNTEALDLNALVDHYLFVLPSKTPKQP